MILGPPVTGWPDGYGRIVLDEVDSTMAEAARRAPEYPTWILAHRQIAGRGRRGRPWVAPNGHFAATLSMRTDEPPAVAALRSFVAALALFDAFAEISGRPDRFALKWPNDVLLDGGKVAGILLESEGQGGRLAYLAIGFGVNLDAMPDAGALEPGAMPPATLRAASGQPVGAETFLDVLAPAYAAREAEFRTAGFGPIRAAWLKRAARLGERLTARIGATEVAGRFETVAPDGALVLATAEGERAIAAAEVFF